MRFATLLLLAVSVSALAAEAPAPDYVLPGSFTRDTTLAALKTRFGAEQVAVQTLDGAEGETFEGVVLFPSDPARRAEIIPAGERAGDGIAAIRISGTGSKWTLDTGVHLGMTLEALVKRNGAPLVFSGLDWDYGGAIQQWNGGALEPKEGDPIHRSLTLTHADDAPEGSYPLGDGEFRSDDRAYPQQGRVVRVGQIMVSFAPAAEESAPE
jgi:hypothetical protein